MASAAVLPGLARRAHAAPRDHILIGRPNPSTGPLAAFGEGTPWIDQEALAAINAGGGIFIASAGKKLPLRIKLVDTESDPSRAAEAAARLIVRDRVDLMLTYHTPDTVNPVSGICERYGVPAISLDAPLEPWLAGGPYRWCFHAFWSVEKDILPAYTGMWEQMDTNRVVGMLMSNDPDGVSWSAVFTEALTRRGYRVVDLGRFPYWLQDFTPFINAWKKEKVEILLGILIPPDFVTAWRQCRRMGFLPKVCTIGKAILFPSVVNSLGGDLPAGLTMEVWWSPHHPFKSSLTGETAGGLCGRWMRHSGREWLQTLGYKHAGYEIAADALARAGSLDREALRRAVAATGLDTIVGPIRFNPENYGRTPLVGGQWVKGKKFPWEIEIVHNREHPEIPATGKVVPLAPTG